VIKMLIHKVASSLKKQNGLFGSVMGVITIAVLAVSVTGCAGQSTKPENNPAAPTSSSKSGSNVTPTTNSAASSVSLDHKSAIMEIGETYQLSASTTPAGAAGQSLSWSSSDTTVAMVSNTGLVTAQGTGNALIRVSSSDGKSDACTVTVVIAPTPTEVDPTPVVPTPGPGSFSGSEFKGSSQVITVVAINTYTRFAVVNAYQKTGGNWKQVFSNLSALIGENGIVDGNQRIQGSYTTPAGVFGMPFAFGFAPNPGTKLEYWVTDINSYWDGNPGPTYNRWVEGDPGGDNEQLQTEPLYKYAIVIDFNWDQVAGRGSGIFLHIKPHQYTAGCVGIDESALVDILKWLDPADNPKIVIAQQSDLSKYYR
jgi:L,D-peptidoglycan transpeptidase YkuD (ErfK/YbiS/YcfS/YnhG family)